MVLPSSTRRPARSGLIRFCARFFCLAALLPAQYAGAQPAAEADPDPAGHWKGAIVLPNGELAIAVTLAAGDDGWSGTIDIPAQGLRGFELAAVAVEGSKVHFEMAGIPGTPTFDGEVEAGGDAISGDFAQGGQRLTFALERSGEEPPADAGPTLPAAPVPGEGLAGEWLGSLDLGPMTLRLVLRLEASEDDLSGHVESVDQGGAKIPIEMIRFEKGQLELDLPSIGGSFRGTMNEDGSAIEGTWSQGGNSWALTFHRLAEPFALARPQTPQPPFPYDEREARFSSGEIELAGTLLVPEGEGPFPAVVFVTGSGPQDRDESLMGHKPFWVIADHLARHGIASLRYDDRGVGESGGDHMGSTVADFAADAAAAVSYLAAQPGIDRRAIGVLGHSEGGLTGPRAALAHDEVDFLVLLAPPGEPLDALLARQGRDSLRLQGVPDALIDKVLAAQAEDLRWIQDETLAREALVAKLEALSAARRETFTEAELARLGVTDATIAQGIAQGSTPWFRSLMREDPSVHLSKTKIPTLALFGEKDVQVAAKVNAELVEASLAAAGNQDFEVRILPGLNHLFQHADTGAIAEYQTIEETIAPEVLELVTDWIVERASASSLNTNERTR